MRSCGTAAEELRDEEASGEAWRPAASLPRDRRLCGRPAGAEHAAAGGVVEERLQERPGLVVHQEAPAQVLVRPAPEGGPADLRRVQQGPRFRRSPWPQGHLYARVVLCTQRQGIQAPAQRQGGVDCCPRAEAQALHLPLHQAAVHAHGALPGNAAHQHPPDGAGAEGEGGEPGGAQGAGGEGPGCYCAGDGDEQPRQGPAVEDARRLQRV
mmetsp:Transcript_14718/g.57740  ORF Transcript_14718/g.57740 Transcript_14718/m.57740 type:complete len:211 (+) Transcript_14718:100-732(+)